MSNSAFAYRNWLGMSGATISAGSGQFEDGAPIENALTPQLGQVAIATAPNINISISADVDSSPSEYRKASVIALLNHNIATSFAPEPVVYATITVRTISGNIPIEIRPGMLGPPGPFQRHLFLFLDDFAEMDIYGIDIDVPDTTVCGRRSAESGLLVSGPFEIGGVWMSRMFRPRRGLSFGSVQQGVIEIPRGARSIGGQNYTLPMPKQRTLAGSITLTPDSETQAYIVDPTLQDMAAWCGTSRQVIAMTDITSTVLLQAQSVVGYFDNPLSWNHQTNTRENGNSAHEYSGSFSVTEAL